MRSFQVLQGVLSVVIPPSASGCLGHSFSFFDFVFALSTSSSTFSVSLLLPLTQSINLCATELPCLVSTASCVGRLSSGCQFVGYFLSLLTSTFSPLLKTLSPPCPSSQSQCQSWVQCVCVFRCTKTKTVGTSCMNVSLSVCVCLSVCRLRG